MSPAVEAAFGWFTLLLLFDALVIIGLRWLDGGRRV